MKNKENGGEGGIRTLDRLLTYAGFQDRCIQPLCHLSVAAGISGNQTDLSISIRVVFPNCRIFINFLLILLSYACLTREIGSY